MSAITSSTSSTNNLPEPATTLEEGMQNPSLAWNIPMYKLVYSMLSEGANLVVQNSIFLIALSFDAVTAGSIYPLNHWVNTGEYRNPGDTNLLATEFLIFLKILNKDCKFNEKNITLTTFETHKSLDNAKNLLSSSSRFKRIILSRGYFLGIGLHTLVKQVIIVVFATLVTLAATLTLGCYKNLNKTAISYLASTNLLHTAIFTLRMVINPEAAGYVDQPIKHKINDGEPIKDKINDGEPIKDKINDGEPIKHKIDDDVDPT